MYYWFVLKLVSVFLTDFWETFTNKGDNIPSGETKNGLKNSDYFTRLHCQCDKEFKECLKKDNSKTGNEIGAFYFNVRDKCYKEQHEIAECTKFHNK